MKQALKFTIVVCSYNGAAHIKDTLTSLGRLKYPKDQYEIVLVDDGSTDDMVKIAKRFKRVRVVSHQQNQGIAAARNTGLKEAKGRWIAYIDDDCTASANWLHELEAALKQPNTMGAGGYIAPRSTKALTQRYLIAAGYGRPAPVSLGAAKGIVGRFVAYIKDKYTSHKQLPTKDTVNVHEVYGANVAFPRTKLKAIKGFNKELNTSEDADICTRLHQQNPDKAIRFNPRAVVKHSYTANFWGYLKKLFGRQYDTLRYYKQQRKVPPIYPFPLLIGLLVAVSAFISWPVALGLLALLPLALYGWWPVDAVRQKKPERLLFAYMEWLEETTRVLGLGVAAIKQLSVPKPKLAKPKLPAFLFARHSIVLDKAVLFAAISGWLLLFNLLQLSQNPLQGIIATITLLALPGVLLMLVLRVRLQSLRTVLYALMASIALLILTALASDIVVLLTNKQVRLNSELFVAAFDLMIAGLMITAWYRTPAGFVMSLPFKLRQLIAGLSVAATLPFMGVLGSLTLNNTDNNALSMVTLGIAFVVMAVLVWKFKKIPSWVIPVILYSLSLTFVLMGSMRGSMVSGTDISREFYLFNLVQQLGYWSPSIYQDAYNSCLTIHLFPTLLSDVIKISGETIYRLVLPALYATVPLMVYGLYKRFNQRMIALAGALFFMVQPVFMKWSAIPVRQMFAFLFFGGLLLVVFDRSLPRWQRYTLFTLFSTGIVFSHYSTAYISLGILCLAFVVVRGKYLFDTYLRKQSRTRHFLITAPMVLIVLASAWLWYGPVTHASGHAMELIQSAVKHVAKGNFNILGSNAHAEQAHLLDQLNIAAEPRKPQVVWDEYVKGLDSKYEKLHITSLQSKFAAAKTPITPSAPEKLPPTVNETVSKGVALGGQTISKLTRVFLIIGLLIAAYQFLKRRNPEHEELHVLTLSAAVAIFLIIVVPYASIDYDIGRTSQQLLMLLALPTVIGGLAALRFITRGKLRNATRLKLLAGIVVVSFLFISNLIPQLVGGQQPSNLLNNSGVQHQIQVPQGEIAAAQWLKINSDTESRIYSGYFGRNRLWVAGIPSSSIYNDILPWTVDKHAYVYASQAESQQGLGTIYHNGSFVMYNYPTQLLEDRKNIIYSSEQARVYK